MRRPLSEFAIGISISEAEDLHTLGFTASDLNRITVELCRRFVALGAQIVLGHQWRPRGIMEAVTRFAQAYQSEHNGAIISNFLAWPDRAALSPKDREQLQGLLAIHEVQERPKTEAGTSRVGALREMRRKMAIENHARICLSGRLGEPEGFTFGVLEEAALTLELNKPVYFSRMMGGTSTLMIEALQTGRPPGSLLRAHSPEHNKYVELIAGLGEKKLATLCGLTQPELHEVFEAENVDTLIHLSSRGLMNVQVRK